jgi:glutathione S-transferase
MIKIYGSGRSRWAKCIWAARELNIPHEEVTLNMYKDRDHLKPEYQKINPFSKTPTMVDGDTVLFESSAIINYLGEQKPETGFTPKSGTPARATYDQWMFFSATELERPLWHWFRHNYIFGEGRKSEIEMESSVSELLRILETLNTEIGARDFMVGDNFTGADLSLAYTLNWARSYDFLSGLQNLSRYTRTHCERPSFPTHLYKNES